MQPLSIFFILCAVLGGNAATIPLAESRKIARGQMSAMSLGVRIQPSTNIFDSELSASIFKLVSLTFWLYSNARALKDNVL